MSTVGEPTPNSRLEKPLTLAFPPLRLLCMLLLATACGTLGCALDTPVLQRGGNGRMGVLLNYSCGAHACDPIDPAKPTIVITHGWNPLPKRIHTTFASSGACVLKRRCGDSYNLLSWDWNGVSVSPFNDEPLRVGRCQGQKMAAALRARGIDPTRTQFIAHSLGTIAVAEAARCLSDLGPTAQLTLLDSPETYHQQTFCQIGAIYHARCVENYWAPGPSGYGGPVSCPGVRNYCVSGPAPIRGIVDLSVSNHVHVMRWYYETMRCPSMSHGFQNSVLLGCCGACRPQAQMPERRHAGDAVRPIELLQPDYVAGASAGSRKR